MAIKALSWVSVKKESSLTVTTMTRIVLFGTEKYIPLMSQKLQGTWHPSSNSRMFSSFVMVLLLLIKPNLLLMQQNRLLIKPSKNGLPQEQ